MFNCILVDDEKWVGIDIQKTVQWMDYGFNPPIYFQNPHEAFDAICSEKPEVVITDVRMPGMTGLDLIGRLRARKIESEIVILSAYEDFEAAQIALRLRVFDYCLKPIKVPQIESVLEALAEKFRTKSKGHQIVTDQRKEYSSVILKVISYLEENMEEKITLSDVAEKIYINKNYLCSLFHEETGKTFSEYLTELRIEQAKHLLQHSELTIMEISEKLAYCDNFYFTKVFKRKMGMSPNRYRKLHPMKPSSA
ncbi:MAG: AraC family transcriptional regulator [Anaerolineales bacterium]|nr:AraC family transcriptional regulator [Anaerolineales bacterium]